MKSGELNFLEPSGALQACNGTALPFLQEVQWDKGGTEAAQDFTFLCVCVGGGEGSSIK